MVWQKIVIIFYILIIILISGVYSSKIWVYNTVITFQERIIGTFLESITLILVTMPIFFLLLSSISSN